MTSRNWLQRHPVAHNTPCTINQHPPCTFISLLGTVRGRSQGVLPGSADVGVASASGELGKLRNQGVAACSYRTYPEGGEKPDGCHFWTRERVPVAKNVVVLGVVVFKFSIP